jgi:hypothetical protein
MKSCHALRQARRGEPDAVACRLRTTLWAASRAAPGWIHLWENLFTKISLTSQNIIGLLTRDSLQNKRKYGIPGFARKKLFCSRKVKSNSIFTKCNTY